MFLVSTCPYCQTEKIPLNIRGHVFKKRNDNVCEQHKYSYVFTICENCFKPTVFLVYENNNGLCKLSDEFYKNSLLNIQISKSISPNLSIEKIIRPPENILYQCPEHVPEDIKAKFDEATQCQASNCIVASSIMLRLCLETVTKNLLETEADKKQKLYKQIKILSTQGRISPRIQAFATEIRLDGNDAVHEGLMDQENLQDLFDFTIALLEDVYTQPRKIELSQERRAQRKQQGTTS